VDTADDAGVYSLGDGRALVQTMDIFTPVVDSAYDWGRIAAANAVSDIYAMGATPMSALQYLAWPRDELPFELAGQVVKGGMDVLELASCTVVGGHSIDGDEPTYGFAVSGVVSLDSVVTNAGGLPGDVLILTKPLGVGIITTALKRGAASEAVVAPAVESMAKLNDEAGAALQLHGAHAATDVTGFGFLGHLNELTTASGVGATIQSDSIPILPGATELLAQKMWPGGSHRNLQSMEPIVESHVDREMLKLLVDAQTSGGILAALDSGSVDGYLSQVSGSVVVGQLTPEPGIIVR
jgi:selenide,water dikinase